MPLASLRLKTALAYPVVEVPLNWAVCALLLWDQIDIIWDPDDLDRLRDFASRTPVLIDHGFVNVARPSKTDVEEASSRIADCLADPTARPPYNSEFANTFALHPVKVTTAYWDSVRRSKGGFVRVPPEFGATYVGLLAEEMAKRANCSTVSMRYDEPLFLAGAASSKVASMTPEDCVVRASLEVLKIKLKKSPERLRSDLAEETCRDIIALRKLDGWHAWRECVCKYLDVLEEVTPDEDAVVSIASEMQPEIRKFQKEASQQKWATLGKIGVAAAGGVVGLFVGSLPGAITGAAVGGAGLGIDLYQSRGQQEGRRSGWQHFVLGAQKRFS